MRQLKELKQRNPALKICAVDYWDFEGGADLRERKIAKKILDCVKGRKKAVGIVGGYHTGETMLTGVVRRQLRGKMKLASVVFLAGELKAYNGPEAKAERCAGCYPYNAKLQDSMLDLNAPVVVKSQNLSATDKQVVGRDRKSGFPLSNDYLVFQRPELNTVDELPQEIKNMIEKMNQVTREGDRRIF
jgi:hypothetical protein